MKSRILTANGDKVVAIVVVGISSSINKTTSNINRSISATLPKMSKRLAKALIIRLVANGVDPKLLRSRVEIDSDDLSRRTHGDIDTVKETRVLGLKSNLILSSSDALDDGGTA